MIVKFKVFHQSPVSDESSYNWVTFVDKIILDTRFSEKPFPLLQHYILQQST